jgi:tRNA modification GTPase
MNSLDAAQIRDADAIGDGATIAAIATASGRAALALVRVSGPLVPSLANRLLRPPPSAPRRAVHARVVDPDSGAAVDDVVAVLYRAPNTFTGEDLLEITSHGGAYAPTSVLSALLRAGARQAEAGRSFR